MNLNENGSCSSNEMERTAFLPEAPVKWHLLVKENVVKASFWAVLRHYGDIRHLNTSANKLAQVGVIELPGVRVREREKLRTPYLVRQVVL